MAEPYIPKQWSISLSKGVEGMSVVERDLLES